MAGSYSPACLLACSGSVREIQDRLPGADRPAYTTIQTIATRLEAKKAIRRVKKVGNAYVFEPAAPWQIVLPAAGRPAAEYVGRTFRSGVPVAPMADLKVRPTSINAVEPRPRRRRDQRTEEDHRLSS